MTSQIIWIDGISYNVPVIGIDRDLPFLDKKAERNLAGLLDRELIGIFKNHRISFGAITETDDYYRLFEKLTEPEEFHDVTVPDNGQFYTYKAYFAGISDSYRRYYNGIHYWKNLVVDFIAQAPWRTP